MKKVMMMCLMLGLLVPAFAEDKCKGEACPASRGDSPAFAAKQHDDKKIGEFKKARKEHKKKMKATEEKVEKLVEEYKKLKSGKKKDIPRPNSRSCRQLLRLHQKRLCPDLAPPKTQIPPYKGKQC